MSSRKTCTSCGAERPATPAFFHRRAASKDKLDPLCKPCKNEQKRRQKYGTLRIDNGEEFQRGDVWAFRDGDRELLLHVWSVGVLPFGHERRVLGSVNGKRRTVSASDLRAGRLVSRASAQLGAGNHPASPDGCEVPSKLERVA